MQVDGYSLEGQKNMLTRFADREEMIIVDTYEDAGKSGKSIEAVSYTHLDVYKRQFIYFKWLVRYG